MKPTGWLLTQEKIQADTLGGHLQYFFVNGSQWFKDKGPPPYGAFNQMDYLEAVPYWLNGACSCRMQR